MPSQCATLGTPSVIPPMTMKSCFNPCVTRSMPPFKLIHQLPPSYYYPTGGAPAATPTWTGLTTTWIRQINCQIPCKMH
eukprot:94856-Pelagomonas_calceolata.AAC.1